MVDRRRTRGRLAGGVARVLRLGERIGPGRLRVAWHAILVAWFLCFDWLRIGTMATNGYPVGQDIRIYYRAAQAWLHGGDPWAVSIQVGHSTFSYAGSPATTVLLAPSALLPEQAFAVLWLALGAAAAILTVRLLRLPYWWLLFPPTVEGLYSGNPQLVVLALLLLGRGRYGVVADNIAVALKVYTAIPIAGERTLRRLVAAAGLTLATMVVAPGLWMDYLRAFSTISSRILHESEGGFSAFSYAWLLVPVIVLLLILWSRDRHAAGWLAVPAVWPASEFHYSTFALPVMTPILAVLLAIPLQGLPPVAIGIDVAWRLTGPRMRRGVEGWLGPRAIPSG